MIRRPMPGVEISGGCSDDNLRAPAEMPGACRTTDRCAPDCVPSRSFFGSGRHSCLRMGPSLTRDLWPHPWWKDDGSDPLPEPRRNPSGGMPGACRWGWRPCRVLEGFFEFTRRILVFRNDR